MTSVAMALQYGCGFVLPSPNIGVYFILDSENQCISKLDKIGIFIDMKFH